MDHAPYAFIMHHEEKNLQRFLSFKHRTFNATDALYFIQFIRNYFLANKSLETAFANFISQNDENVEHALTGFHDFFFTGSCPEMHP